jgi:hypothetical protein
MSGGSGHLRRQFDTAWLLADLHLNGLDTEECLWRPAPQGLHVHRAAEGVRAWLMRNEWPVGDVVAWVNLELTKNAAEIGYARFLYAVRR